MTKQLYKDSNSYVVRGSDGVVAEGKAVLILREEGVDDRVFFHRDDIAIEFFDPSETTAKDPVLGEAEFFHLAGRSDLVQDVAWRYSMPQGDFSDLEEYLTFDPSRITVEAL